jgi:hypothetical protein
MAKKKSSKRRGESSEESEPPDDTFEYHDLEDPQTEIRLIKIHTQGKSISIRLEHFDLDNAPDYSALSYTWGNATPTREITVNRRQMSIRQNLYKFLRVFQAKHLHEWLWVDQICINQGNTKERNEQVQLMSEIYRNAFEVKIWLGPDDHPDNRIFRERIRGASASKSLKQNSLEDMFSKVYWSRLWVLQEMLLAKRRKIYYGYDFIDWSRFQALCEPSNKEALVEAPDHIRWLSRRATSARNVLVCDAIMHCTDNDCYDPRDKIYGIQSLFAEGNRLKVNYAKGIDVVFIDAALMIAKSEVCVIDEGHSMVCPDAPAECECTPLGELEQLVLSIDQLAYAMDLTAGDMVRSGQAVENAVQQYRTRPDTDTKKTLITSLRAQLQLDGR